MMEHELLPVVDLENLSDETLGKLSYNYITAKKVIKKYTMISEFYHKEIVDRLESKGVLYGKHKMLEDAKFIAVKEKRDSITVSPHAISFFIAKGWERDIQVSAAISIKPNTDVSLIPQELLDSMNKYFDITVSKMLGKDAILGRLADNSITQEEYDSMIEIKSTYALKITEKSI